MNDTENGRVLRPDTWMMMMMMMLGSLGGDSDDL